ncbi:transposase [Limobrevibacterium gyesilva]|uniref:Transposase n=1 Tax=Limobrevibacterium gyesilva TaxID=2991712 RepID=A0AA42CKD0_9PROT|nr:transposase [Limobrevibacterium gyesilva]MCW3477710.1 transposase [Limobrevibacterium gyesilva]
MESASDHAMHQHRHEGDAYHRIEVITGTVRRWTDAENVALVAESMWPGVNVSNLARRFGVARGLLQTWRRHAIRQAEDGEDGFVPLCVEDVPAIAGGSASFEDRKTTATPGSPPASETSAMEIESGGLRIRFTGPVDAGTLRVVLAHVRWRA